MNQVDITEAQKDFHKLIVAVNRGNYIALIEDEKPVAVCYPFQSFVILWEYLKT
jgi:antitoxin (DNA-binding transcriptional repressor) of toxin-antitoxin stability system